MRWRESASLILTSTFKNEQCGHPFKVLMLKRSSKSKFMPNLMVFPGGVVDKADFDVKWLDILKGTNQSLPKWTSKLSLPLIYQKKQPDEGLERTVAFRINAIRETFEETGIFLGTNIPSTDLAESWRDRVHENPTDFLKMCQETDSCPNIWSLYEWADWLTPLRMKSRFDTIFYITNTQIQTEMKASADGDKEVSEVEFMSPAEALEETAKGTKILAPPQVYEMARLANFQSQSELENFSMARSSNYGVPMYFPIPVICQDGTVFLYPGDEAYPKKPDIHGNKEVSPVVDMKEITMKDFGEQFKMRNRLETVSPSQFSVVCNIKDPSGHRTPFGSKL